MDRMPQCLLLIAFILSHVLGTLSEDCSGCDPDIPSRQTPKDWYHPELKQTKFCNPGQFLSNKNDCIDCLYGTFMTGAMAKTGLYTFCPPCLKPQSNLEVITVQCSSARDTEILCVDGSYRKSNCSCGAECVRCSVCGVGSKMFQPYQMRSCSQHSDAVCCANADDIIVGDHCTPVPTTTSTTKTTQRITTPPKATDVIEEEAVPMKEISENTGNSAGRGHVFHDILVVLELLTVTLFFLFCVHV